jgi:hypothetical protein
LSRNCPLLYRFQISLFLSKIQRCSSQTRTWVTGFASILLGLGALMLDLAQISQAVENYKNGQWSLDDFADWFVPVSRRKFSESPEVLKALLQIDSLVSQLYFDGLSESVFREELANAVRPFVLRKLPLIVVYDERPREQRPTFALARAALVAAVLWNPQPNGRPLPAISALVGSSSMNTVTSIELAPPLLVRAES